MENFNLKQYYYEQKATGLSDARIAETLGTTEDKLREILGFKKVESVNPVDNKTVQTNNSVDNKTEETKFVDKKDKKNHQAEVKKTEPQEDLSWME